MLLAAIGGIIMVLNRDSSDQPPPVSITPTNTAPPTEQPTPDGPADRARRRTARSPRPADTTQPAAERHGVDLGNGISLTPASGWEVQKTSKGVAQLSNGQSVFLGQVIQAEANTNPGQLCDAWHRKVAEGTSNGKFQDAEVGRRRHLEAERWHLPGAGHGEQRPGLADGAAVLAGLGADQPTA